MDKYRFPQLHEIVQRLVLLLVWILIVSGAASCSPPIFGKLEPITIGAPPLESSALIYIADHEGMFANYGIQMTMRDYETGAASLNGLDAGEVDIAVPAEYALVGKAFGKDKICVLGSIGKSQYFYIVAREDLGIANFADLKGKKIGVVRNTIAEFYLGRFLERRGILASQVTLVDVNIADSEQVILSGNVDAIMTRPPYIIPIQERLGDSALVWEAQNLQALYAVLIARTDWIADHPELLRQFYRALVQAEEYLVRHPSEAKSIVQTRLKLDDAYMAAVWSQNQYALSLDQSLIIALEDEARWMIKHNLTNEKTTPNFTEYICEDALKAVKPEAVNIIR
ncbi:MAG: NrtA/SsuA/CpmA family ABC transporter substrate-binding protein [Chloroflexi bacterium]|nr:NrtA/SsuA/CpmA family ABC transporter substrate-binding protein [Chloroflexota bacterium]